MSIVFFVLMVFGASLIQTVSGFGFGIVAMSLFPYCLPTTAIGTGISTCLATGTDLGSVLKNRKLLNLKLILPLLAGYLGVSALVITFLGTQADSLLRRILGAVLIILSVYLFFCSGKIKIRPCFRNGVITGILSGFTGGLFAISGPPAVVYLLAATDDNDTYNGNIQLFFLITNIYNLVIRTCNGLITQDMWQYVLIGIPAMLAGIVCGQKTASRLKPPVIRRIVYCVMLVSGAVLLF